MINKIFKRRDRCPYCRWLGFEKEATLNSGIVYRCNLCEELFLIEK